MTSSKLQVDPFIKQHMPSRELLPVFTFELENLRFPEQVNCVYELLDKQVEAGYGSRIAVQWIGGSWTYEQLLDKTNRVAKALVQDLGIAPGHRVLVHSSNSPMLMACLLGIMKAGAIAVPTMPLLRARDLKPIIEKANVQLALCEEALHEELLTAQKMDSILNRICVFHGTGEVGSELGGLMNKWDGNFNAVPTAAEDVALLLFTSGTTGEPKGTIHFHRDVLAVCVCFCDHIIRPTANDVFIGTPPIAFAYGLGMHVAFPLHAGARVVLINRSSPVAVAEAIIEYKATVMAASPTAYRTMLREANPGEFESLRLCISAGEHLPLPTFDAWHEATGLQILDGLGATEMLHIFLSHSERAVRPGSTGRAVPGYEVAVLNKSNEPAAPNEPGRLAVRGPTGCRYLADARQVDYVVNGWNVTGDICVKDEDGYIWYHGRSDDMIVSGGYNISAGDVESALLCHEHVTECAVIGVPDAERGNIVKAFVVLAAGVSASSALVQELQEFVKQTIAPYKYPRSIEFIDALPRTPTGKIQRHKLKQMAAQAG